MFTQRVCMTAASVILLVSSVLAAESSNSSQNVIPNAAGDKVLDQTKVNQYKFILGAFADHDDDKFNGAFKWTDILDDYASLGAECSARCLTCAPGCNPSCCAPGSPADSSKKDDTAPLQSPNVRLPRFPGRPNSPLACPCFCEAGCPKAIQTVCCTTPGTNGGARIPPASAAGAAPAAAAEDLDSQKTLLDSVLGSVTSPRIKNWGRPNQPLACPCFCEASCPKYIQTVCCTTPGTNGAAEQRPITKAPKTHDILAMVTSTNAGDPVSVLAAVNLTAFDSFVTFNLVEGLERANQITRNEHAQTFEITLDLVVGPAGREVAIAQTFVVIDGSFLLEEEQILLGAGALSRAGAFDVDKEFLTNLQEGLPVLTGTQAPDA